jgi:serine/threonine protein kinase/Tfp pilus assembly protein PilF
MKNKQWQQVETIFHKAISLDGEQRVSYLSEACSGDVALLSEIDSLIYAFERESMFLDQSAFSLGLSVISQSQETNLTGKDIGCYQIKNKLGGGGMGDVYLAHDTRLNRKVALKFLKNTLLDDKWAKRQLIREAQAVAMLEHPNICQIHSIEEIDGHNFIAMQYIEGETLGQFIAARQLSLQEIVSIARQIISAVVSAHSRGIIHRDIKPGNIIITPDGQAKVLDFGLAKLVQQKQKAGRDEEFTSHISRNGLILGTVSYMSPEQLRAEKLDYRSDIFSVGIVLYELLCKQNPFHLKSQAETIAAILGSEPAPLKSSECKIPDALARVIGKCLEKEKENRFQSAAELLVELENFKEGITARSVRQSFAGIYRYACAALILLLLLGTAIFFFTRPVKLPTLAILPIINESGQADKNTTGDGLTADLINKFSGLSKLKVVAHPLVSRYKEQIVNPKDAANELSADFLLIGKIVRQENALKLNVNLVKAADNTVIMTENYGIEGDELVSVEERLAGQIVFALESPLTESERRQVISTATKNEKALEYYFLGRDALSQQYDDNFKKAIEYFDEARKLDPSYAQAFAGLADAYVSISVPSASNPVPPVDAVKISRAAAKRAIEINPNLCEPYTSLGMIQLRHDWNWTEAENNFKKSISLNSDYASAHYGYSILLNINGRFEEALEEAKKASDADPFTPNIQMNLARVNYYKRNFSESVQIYADLSEKNPENYRISYGLGLLYLKVGRLKEGTEILEQVVKSNKPLAAAALGYAYAKAGRREEALQLISDLQQLSKERYVSAQEKAFVYFGLDDREQAFGNLKKACDERFPALPSFLIDPLFDEFHADARFAEVRKCANVPQWIP